MKAKYIILLIVLIILVISGSFAYNFFQRTSNSEAKCYPLWKIESTNSDNQGISATQYYAKECTNKTSKEECEIVDVYRASTNNFGNSDGIPDCEWK